MSPREKCGTTRINACHLTCPRYDVLRGIQHRAGGRLKSIISLFEAREISLSKFQPNIKLLFDLCDSTHRSKRSVCHRSCFWLLTIVKFQLCHFKAIAFVRGGGLLGLRGVLSTGFILLLWCFQEV